MTEPEVVPDYDDPGAQEVGACPGHEWIDVTSLGDIDQRFLCAGCGMPGKPNPRVRRIGDEFGDPRFRP